MSAIEAMHWPIDSPASLLSPARPSSSSSRHSGRQPVGTTPDDVEAARRHLEDAQKRAARDAEVLRAADSVVADSRASRAENGWADAFRALFRG